MCVFMSCKVDMGVCEFMLVDDGSECSDGSVCTVLSGDSCQVGVCVGEMVTCDDVNLCTVDICDPEMGCVHISILGFK